MASSRPTLYSRPLVASTSMLRQTKLTLDAPAKKNTRPLTPCVTVLMKPPIAPVDCALLLI